MTAAYRERLRIDRPVAAVRAALDATLDRTGEDRWSARRLGGLYRYRIALDAAAGELSVRVLVPPAVRAVAVLAPIALALLVAAGAPRPAVVAAVVGCGAVAVAFVGHLAVRPAHRVLGGATTVGERLSPLAIPAHAAVLGWLGLTAWRSPTPIDDGLTLALLVAAVGAHYAANSTRRAAEPHAVRTLAIPVSALLPGLVAATGLFVLGAAAGDAVAGESHRLHLALAVLVGLNVAFLGYCRIVHRRLTGARLHPPRSQLVRTGATVAYAAANAVLLVAVVAGARLLLAGLTPAIDPVTLPGAPTYATLDAAFAPLPGPARPYGVGAVGLALAPVGIVAAAWGHHLATDLSARVVLSRRGRRLAAPGADNTDVSDGVGVRSLDLGAPVVRPVARPFGRDVVLVDVAVADALAADELAAVVAHETTHLRYRSRDEGVLAALASVALGGRNAVLAFVDLRAVEAAADDAAADRVGRAPLIRAIRRLESLRTGRAADAALGGTGRHRRGTTARVRAAARSLLTAPRDLYFGSVLLDGAHRMADERIRRISAGRSDGTAGTSATSGERPTA